MTNHPSTIERLAPAISNLLNRESLRFRRLWAYYRNPLLPMVNCSDDETSNRPYRQAMEWGLPSRITGMRSTDDLHCGTRIDQIQRKEVVIENDIAWRIDTQVDYLFGKRIVLNSAAPDPQRREVIGELLRQILAIAGGITFLQQIALIGAVHGFVDLLVKLHPDDAPETIHCSHHTHELGSQSSGETPPATRDDDPARFAPQDLAALARRICIEIVEPSRALPLLRCDDWKTLDAYAQVWKQDSPSNAPAEQRDPRATHIHGWFETIRSILSPNLKTVRHALGDTTSIPDHIHTELLTKDTWQRYQGGRLVSQGQNALGEIPLVHIQNSPLPHEYSGQSDVEPLIPIQDEINTRLSDRGYRITMQSFKMYLGIGIDNFIESPVSPGRMWMTDNEKAKVLEFGGDGKTFSEDNQIAEMREAMDKISGVTPIAAGVTRRRIGHLTSAAALKVTMLALLAKTERKRTMYGNGIARMCELALAWLDKANLFHTTPEERRIEINWPSPLPVNEIERLHEARLKRRVGVARDLVLKELGYAP